MMDTSARARAAARPGVSRVARGRVARTAGAVLLTAGLALGTLAHVASAQVTARDLIGKYVEPGPKHAEVKQAIDRFQTGNTTEALELLKSASKKNPELPPGEVLFAQLCFFANATEAGRHALEMAVEAYPKDPEAYVGFGELALADRRITDAEALFNRAVELSKSLGGNPKRLSEIKKRIYNGMTAVAESREHWDQAAGYLQAWAREDKDNASLYQRLARAQFKTKKYNEAFQALQAAKKLNDKIPRPEVTMGLFYEQAGDRQKAAEYMAAAAKTGENEIETQMQICEWAVEANQLDEARKRADGALRLDPNRREAKLLRGLVARIEKDYKTAKQYFESAHLQSPTDFACTNQLALTLVELPDQAEKTRALEYAMANRKLFPKISDTGTTLGWVYHRMGNNGAAMQVLEEVARAGGLSADGAYYAAKIFTELDRTGEASRLLEQALGGKIGKISQPYRADAESLLALLTRSGGAKAPLP